MTPEERAEVVARAHTAARAGQSLNSNPYDRDKQPELWRAWRFAFVDAVKD